MAHPSDTLPSMKAIDQLRAAVGLAPRTGRRAAPAPAPAPAKTPPPRVRRDETGLHRQEHETGGKSADLHKLSERERAEVIPTLAPPPAEDPRKHPLAQYERGRLNHATLRTALARAGKEPADFLRDGELAEVQALNAAYKRAREERERLSYSTIRKAAKAIRQRIARGELDALAEHTSPEEVDLPETRKRRSALSEAAGIATKRAAGIAQKVSERMAPVIEQVLGEVIEEERRHFDDWGIAQDHQPSTIVIALADLITALRFERMIFTAPDRLFAQLGIDIKPTTTSKK